VSHAHAATDAGPYTGEDPANPWFVSLSQRHQSATDAATGASVPPQPLPASTRSGTGRSESDPGRSVLQSEDSELQGLLRLHRLAVTVAASRQGSGAPDQALTEARRALRLEGEAAVMLPQPTEEQLRRSEWLARSLS
jgi:hypothetical protein